MTALYDPPAAAITAPGLGWNVDLTGHPHAGDATFLNGRPVVTVSLGTIAGREVELDITTLAEMDEIEDAFRLAHARLAICVRDHVAGAA